MDIEIRTENTGFEEENINGINFYNNSNIDGMQQCQGCQSQYKV